MTLKVAVFTFFASSVAVTVITVVPSGNFVPLAWLYVIAGAAVTASVAVAAG
ncbi:MAG: hypothetical protein V1899_03470 [Planctomycetota bacterium]